MQFTIQREISRINLLAVSAAFLMALALPAQEADRDLRVDGDRLNRWLQELGEIGRGDDGSSLRMSFSDADRQARDLVSEWMQGAGLTVSVDAAGNLIAGKPGSAEGLAPIMIGSHIDSVPHGGKFDGPAGSLAAIEVARSLADARLQLRHPLEIVIFSNEENGKSGSKAMAGEVSEADLTREVLPGVSLAEGMNSIGGNAQNLASVQRSRGSLAAFLELHIEQGAFLEKAGIPIGVVQGIVGIKRWQVSFTGFANHAGTTPMAERQDALVAAAEFISAVNHVAKSTPGRQVATVGRIEVHPSAANVIPGRAELSLEIRDLEMEKIDRVYAMVQEVGKKIAAESSTEFRSEQYYTSTAAPTDPEIQALIMQAADGLDLDFLAMPSGAGHDAQSIAQFAPIGMIFIPSRGGISHSPEEYSAPEQVTAGANVLLQSLLLLDRR
ncbi:MAG: allantoate amidohydrolase [Planctomycetota bacterium]|jgi:N-carbamoyl-L-amino-acid hydrolase